LRIGQAHTDLTVAVALVVIHSCFGDAPSALSYFRLLH
jgi:hypothetical protein